MHAESFEGRRVGLAQAAEHIVGIQHGQPADPLESFATHGQGVRIGAHHHKEAAVEGGDFSDALFRLPKGITVTGLHHARPGKVRFQAGGHGNGARPGPAHAMRRAEGLVQVKVHDVESQVTRAAAPDNGVEIRAVVIHKRARLVGKGRDFRDARLKQAVRVWAGQHDTGDMRAEQVLERIQIHRARGGRRNRLHFEPGDGRTGGIRAVGGIRDQDGVPGSVAPVAVISGNEQHAGKLAVCARHGLQASRLHAADLREQPFHLIDKFQGAAAIVQVGVETPQLRVQPGKTGQGRHGLGHLGIVFHGARAERVELGVHAEIALRQACEMTNHVELAHFGKGQRRIAAQGFRQHGFGHIQGRRHYGAATRNAGFKNRFKSHDNSPEAPRQTHPVLPVSVSPSPQSTTRSGRRIPGAPAAGRAETLCRAGYR